MSICPKCEVRLVNHNVKEMFFFSVVNERAEPLRNIESKSKLTDLSYVGVLFISESESSAMSVSMCVSVRACIFE